MNREITDDLIKWKESKNRKSLIINGARQVRKTLIFFDEIQVNERDMTKYADSNLSNRIILAFDSIPVQLAKDNQKFQYKVISRSETSGIFGGVILWFKNSGIVNQGV